MTQNAGRRYWASRVDSKYPDYFWDEIKSGRLRQGWGYDESQDLRLVLEKPWQSRSPEENETLRHRFMVGGEEGWKSNDLIIVPNQPTNGMLALVEVIGEYRFEIDPTYNDYGHIREVRLLTPEGIAKSSHLVDRNIRATLRNAGRTWNIDHLKMEIDILIKHLDDRELLEQSTELQRTERTLNNAMSIAIAALESDFSENLNRQLHAAEWEAVIAKAVKSYFPTAAVRKTAGPNEQGADIEIELPNPFGGASWIIVVQIKDYVGEVGSDVIGQLRKAINTRNRKDDVGKTEKQVVAAVLASTNAVPSAQLKAEIDNLEEELGVPVT